MVSSTARSRDASCATSASASRPGASRITEPLAWDEPRWLEQATRWIDERVERDGDVELLRTRLWSAIVRVPTRAGDVWFKENPPALAFEPALTVLVAGRRPDCSAEVIAAEGPRLLTRHVGPSLRDVYADGGRVPSWHEILPGYGQLQIDLAQDVEAALAAGTPDLRPEELRRHAERFVRPDELDAVSRAVDGLGDAVSPMLTHEEVHEGNVFVRAGRPFFLDWAEACVSHPFVGTVLMLRAATERNGFEPGSPEVGRLRDLYLEPFTIFAPLSELREAYGHAYLLGAICRMVTWDLIVAPYKQAAAADVGDVVGAWLGIYREVAAGTTMLGGA